MNMHKIQETVSITDALAAASRGAGTVTSTGIDLTDYKGDVLWHISRGNAGVGTLDAKVQESADNSSWTDVSPALAITQLTAAGTAKLAIRVRQATKRYVRISATVAAAAVEFGVTEIKLAAQL